MIDAPESWGAVQPDESFQWKPLSEIEERPIRWVEYPYLQASAFHLITGIKNSGKGTWLSSVAARVTRGEYGPQRHVLWLSLGEDSYSVDVRPRIRAAGGDVSQVTVLDGWGFRLPDHGQSLEDKVREMDASMVVIDPLGGAFGGDTSKDQDVRPALQALNYMADVTGTMVFGVRHISNKAGKRGEGILSAILGSSDWVNIPRAILALLNDDVDPQMRHLFAITGNRGPSDTPGVMVRIEGVLLDGHEHEVTQARVIGESAKDPEELLAAKRARKTTRSDAAQILMLQTLNAVEGGVMESDMLDADIARRTGLAAKTIRNVRSEMRNLGLIRAIPVKDTEGEILHWTTSITNAGVYAAAQETPPSPIVAPTPTLSPLTTPLTPTGSLGTTRPREGATNSTGSGNLQGETQIPNQIPQDLGVSTNGVNGHHHSQLGFGSMTPDPPDPPDPVDPIFTGSGEGKPNSRPHAPDVSTMSQWERDYWQRTNGGGA